MFTNEDFADYVVCVWNMYQANQIMISKHELEECINFYYYRFCHHRHLQIQPLVPIRSIRKMIYLPD